MKTLPTVAAIVFVIIGFSNSSCKKDNQVNASNPQSINKIEYGTSFGMCIGYCTQNLTITNAKTEFTKSGWSDTLKVLTCNENTDTALWNLFEKEIDISVFNALEATIGCPDCADGGAEWIEIETGTSKHKVTFEYHHEPLEVKAYIEKLRSVSNGYKDCK